MESKQKYTGETRTMLIDKYVFEEINNMSSFISKCLLEIIERIVNSIPEPISMGVTFNDIDRKPVFFEFWFRPINEYEVYFYDIKPVSSDRYLDLMLEDSLIEMHERKIRRIT